MTTRNSDPSEKKLHSRHIRKLWRMGIMPAAAITVFIVTYALILPAITMSSQNAHCGCEEHAHSPACYGEQGELVCGLEEHAHSLACYSDPDADIENADIWQQELPELTGDRSADVLAVAKSLLGYRESDKNYLVAEGGETKGYTRFGHWYGLTIADISQEEADDITAEDSASMHENGIPDYSYWDWDAMFASYVLSYAGAGDMGADTDAHKWAESLAAAGLYVDPSSYIPSDGDLVFFSPYADEPAMVGIVSNVNKNFFGLGDRVNSISVICGDFDNEVSEIRISMDEYREGDLTSEIIQGYGLLNPETPSEILADDASKIEANADTQDNLQDQVPTDTQDNLQNQVPADTHVSDEAAMAIEGDQSAADAAGMLLEGDQSSAGQTDAENDLANADESDLSNYEQPESDQSSDSANENTSVPDNMACTLLPGETRTLTANGYDYTVTMTYGAESEIPDISKLQVKEIKAGTDDYEECLADTRETLGIDDADADKLHGRFFDIKIMTKEGEFEPKSPVKVEISYKKPIEASEASDFHAIHFG
ncbi:MAG: hypothetical protein Q4A32_10715, partial [Lachnospiraceae bacterium]|nr:hypothetical protein [Lachnospiraceae bacterium]